MADLTVIGRRNLIELPGSLYVKIRDHLNISEQNSGWRALVAVINGFYTLSGQEIADCETSKCPTTTLLNKLGARGMTIEEFVNYAAQADNFFILNQFNNVFVPAQITQHPLEEVSVLRGQVLSLTVKATGYPAPNFQWYKCEMNSDRLEKLEGANYGTYQLHVLSEADSGVYLCAVFNSDDAVLLRFSHPTTVTVLPAVDLVIKEHPQACTVAMGGNALFKCEVWGGDNVCYQWFQDDRPLQDGEQIRGATSNELRLYRVDGDNWLGCYYCQITNGDQTECTKSAVLQISDLVLDHRKLTNYTATDKVALLIGCSDYRSDKELKAPKYDVQTLSSIFQSLGFKVVSLLNLTKSEILSAVYEFRKLIGKGVYCVFYFCGHGFEVSGQCFLVPTDAPHGYTHSHCISADKIFSSLLQQDPQICCMILDICRKSQDDKAVPAFLAQDAVKKGNAVVCYGTSYGLAAYEAKNYGILVYHLKNILSRPVDIETVFQMLRSEMNSDPKVNNDNSERGKGYLQIPEIRTNLLEVHRSFTDPIDYRGHTIAHNERQMIWETAHRKPDPIDLDVPFPDFVVKVRLDFQQEFSNVLKVYVSVVDPGQSETCLAYVSGIPPDVAEKAQSKTVTPGRDHKLSKTYLHIHNIQRLRTDLKIQISVKCEGPGMQQIATKDVSELGRPLVARLELWNEERHRRMAEESQEEELEQGEDYESVLVEELRDFKCH